MGPNFDLRDLRAFLMVAEEEHVGRAADRLNLSASPLSRQMLQMEARLGLQLFERVRKRLRLTGAGRQFQEQARALILHATELERTIIELRRGDRGTIAIGYVPGAMWTGFLPDLLRRFRAAAPDCSLRLQALRSRDGIEQLRKGGLDIAFVHSLIPNADADHESVLLHEDAFVLAVAKGHRLLETREAPTSAILEREDWIGLDAKLSPSFRNRLIAACGSYGFVPEFRYEAPDISSVLGLVEAGLGVAVLQSRVMRMTPANIDFIPLPGFPLSVQVHAVWHSAIASPLVTRLLQLARDGAQGSFSQH